jgi:acyl-CoA synthetase (AMP-forming)/AMP-acid ligase II
LFLFHVLECMMISTTSDGLSFLVAVASLRLVISSGEALPLALLRHLQRVLPSATILNLYGSTEVSADCTCLDATGWLQRGALSVDKQPDLTPVQGDAEDNLLVQERRSEHPQCSTAVHAGASTDPTMSSMSEYMNASSGLGFGVGEANRVPVGRPIDNTAVFIAAPVLEDPSSRTITGSGSVARAMAEVVARVGSFDVLARGQVGEVCVAGAGVAAGYLRHATWRRLSSCSQPLNQ